MRKLIDQEKMHRTIRRISHEVIEQNLDLENLIILGVKSKGVPLAKIIKENILKIENVDVPIYNLDISGYRDDKKISDFQKLDIDLNDKTVLVVDDVLFTGRTVRASMDAIIDLGRPSKIQLAVLVDRGHRELPIRADYVGKNMPTSADELVKVSFTGEIGVYILSKEEKQ
ncbi:Bifunctional protein PyrR [Candidatus Izimaplasma bacterium HR1]|jgi:pyrimidine operon attenuation protein/uracil phosphoribosyltransferase|uniref:bifunctional pyr operon transcriptional regulator/uracil phosphoribosyltransferase PyrR n=1 Tax=Candidatus Izimoplasma sp. HR1 TaxID=1541959 RepID=UPI0004F7C47B|nr:Bifunctional protein PyrR [Candidatus Izimaplasma bacterium HR1]